jgi:hypothetical protein
MTPDSQAPSLPPLPSAAKIKVFLEAGAWVILGSLYPCAVLLWQWLRDPWDNSIAWPLLWDMAWKCAALAGSGYWLKYRAWLLAPPGTDLVQKTVTVGTGGGHPATVEVETKTVSVEPKP